MKIEQFLESALGSSWLLPLLGIGGWLLVKYLSDKFISIADFNAYKEARGEESKEYREFIKSELDERQEYIIAVDRKVNENAKEIARLEGKIDR
jgi:hypothetical protein